MQVAKARVAALGESGVVSLQALAEAVVKRIQVVRVDSMTDFTSKCVKSSVNRPPACLSWSWSS